MAGILVFVEQRNGAIRKASLEALSQAARLAKKAGWPVSAVLVGHAIAGKAAELGAYGAGKVYVEDDERFARYSAEGYAACVRAAARRPPCSWRQPAWAAISPPEWPLVWALAAWRTSPR